MDRNRLILGLAGFAATFICILWIVGRAAFLRKGVAGHWLIALGVLFGLSALTAASSVVAVVSELSSGGGDDHT